MLSTLVALPASLASAPPALPELTEPINDFAHVIDAGHAAEMARMIRTMQQRTGDVVVVVTIKTFAPDADIREYAVKLFENRGQGIGQRGKDNGLLVLLSVTERRVWVEVGYGLEPFVTDGFAGETSRDYMVPAFGRGDYDAGLEAGVTHIIRRIADGRGVTLEGVPEAPAGSGSPSARLQPGLIMTLIVLLILMNSLGRRSRIGPGTRWGGGGWSGWSSGVGPFGGGGGFGGGFGGFGGGRSGGGWGGAGW